MCIRFVLFATNDTNWCRSLDNVLVLILLKEIIIQDGECCGDAIKTTCHTPYNKECGKFERASLDHDNNDDDDSLFMNTC